MEVLYRITGRYCVFVRVSVMEQVAGSCRAEFITGGQYRQNLFMALPLL